MRVAALFQAQDDFDVSALVADLLERAAMPFLSVLRYKATGLRKREQWERAWDLLRREDAGEPAETLRDYIVTPQLVESFDDALKFIKGAIDARSSKAAHLHGSFGSGKSHFMAVLHMILRNNARARGIQELSSVVARYTPWTDHAASCSCRTT